MLFSYNWLQSFFRKKLPRPKELSGLLTMHSFEVEEMEKVRDDFVLDIDVLPNRAHDCFSHIGVAREVAAITNGKFQTPESKFRENKDFKTKDFVSVEVKDKKACPRYTARVVTDVKIGHSPKWLKSRLRACGLHPINNVVDIANYVMLETGQPLHTFDGAKLGGKKIIVRFAKEREKIVTLDEEKYDLNQDILVIADSKKPIAIAGIKGGKIPEIDKKTKIVVIESANFNQRIIRKGSKKLGLRTDASLRFEHGIDSNLTEPAINRACYLIQQVARGKIAQGLVDLHFKKPLPKRVRLDLNYVERLLRIKISKKEIKNILNRLQFKIAEVGSTRGRSPFGTRELSAKRKLPSEAKRLAWRKQLMVEVPTFRLDIVIPEDLIEEIGRIYGYEKIKTVFPTVSLIPPKRNLKTFWQNVTKNILKEAGFTEVYNYSFINEKDAGVFDYKNTARSKLIEVENPISIEQKYLRPSLIPNLLKNVKTNTKQLGTGYSAIKKEIKIFELGKTFQKPTASPQSNIEKRMLTGLITGDSFYQSKGIVDLLLRKLGTSNIWYDQYQPTPEESKISIWHPKKCAEIKVDGKEIGFLGEISHKILAELEIPKAAVFDIDFGVLAKLSSEEHEYRPISRFPAAIRDLAVVVPRGVLVVEVLNKVNASGGPLIRDIDLFDIYEGEEIPAGKKNLAFHIVYQAENRTLSSKEIDQIHQNIIKDLEKNPEWQVRK